MEPCIEQLGKHTDEMVAGAIFLHQEASNKFTVSPLTFMNFMSTFARVFSGIVAKSGGTTKHLISGLEKLSDAHTSVDKLSKEANEKKKKLSVAQKEAAVSMQKI